MSEKVTAIGYSDEYCFDCKVSFRQGIDTEHDAHKTLLHDAQPVPPPTLGISVSDDVNFTERLG